MSCFTSESVVAGLFGCLVGAVGAVVRLEILDYPAVLDVLVLGLLDVRPLETLQLLVGGPLGFVAVVEGVFIALVAAVVMAISSGRNSVSSRARRVVVVVLVIELVGSLRLSFLL